MNGLSTVPVFVWLIAVPLVASPIVYAIGRLARGRSRSAGAWAGFAALAAAWVPLVLAAQEFARSQPAPFVLGTIALRLDGVSLLLAGVALGLGTLVMVYSGPYMGHEQGSEKYYAMLTAIVGVMIGLGCAADLFNLWIWFEAMAVTSYLLVAFYRDEPASLEAGVKYLVQSAIGSALVLIGIALVLMQTGTLDLAAIRNVAVPGPALIAAGALFLIGFGVKAALVPLHTWLPDAHAQAPSGISAMLSGVVIEAGLIALLRVVVALLGVTSAWGAVLMGFGALNMIAGNLLALRQTVVKRLLAFSSVAHVGYMLLGIGVTLYGAGNGGDALGAQGGFFHMLTHGMMKGLAFLAAGALLYSLHIAAGDHGPLTVADLRGAARRYPWVALGLSVAVLGLGGMPPLAGFMSKWQILVAGVATQNPWIVALVVFAALNSLLSLAYYAPLVNAMYRNEPSPAVRNGRPVSWAMYAPMGVLGLGVVLLGVWPQLAAWLTGPAGNALLRLVGE